MFAAVGYAAAVANAHPDLQRAADVVIGGVDEAGVATFLNQLLDAQHRSLEAQQPASQAVGVAPPVTERPARQDDTL
jgi:3-deoxy-D-manno-octulosonate 8-phosphate phosphatase KdsC-like HAD superfamily phosphatase